MDASRFDRDSWLVAAAAAGYPIISVILMLLATSTPSDGWHHEHLDDNRGMLALENISGFGSQLLPGDEVVAVDGQRLTPLMAAFRPTKASTVWWTGGSARYTVEHSGQTLEFNVPIVPGSLLYVWRRLFQHAQLKDDIENCYRLLLTHIRLTCNFWRLRNNTAYSCKTDMLGVDKVSMIGSLLHKTSTIQSTPPVIHEWTPLRSNCQ
jgi:hypothetical protein